jgi:ATP-dependent Clp protease ATP-binding subunit ClpB
VVFHALDVTQLTSIVDIQLKSLARRLSDRRLALEVTSGAKKWLATNGFDPIFGARPLRRLVQSAIGDQLAKALLAGDVRDGDQVTVDIDGDNLKVTGVPV